MCNKSHVNKALFRIVSIVLLIIIIVATGTGILTWILLRPEKEIYPILEGPEIISSDGIKLKAVQNVNQDSHEWVIFVHGYRAVHSMVNELARIYI